VYATGMGNGNNSPLNYNTAIDGANRAGSGGIIKNNILRLSSPSNKVSTSSSKNLIKIRKLKIVQAIPTLSSDKNAIYNNNNINLENRNIEEMIRKHSVNYVRKDISTGKINTSTNQTGVSSTNSNNKLTFENVFSFNSTKKQNPVKSNPVLNEILQNKDINNVNMAVMGSIHPHLDNMQISGQQHISININNFNINNFNFNSNRLRKNKAGDQVTQFPQLNSSTSINNNSNINNNLTVKGYDGLKLIPNNLTPNKEGARKLIRVKEGTPLRNGINLNSLLNGNNSEINQLNIPTDMARVRSELKTRGSKITYPNPEAILSRKNRKLIETIKSPNSNENNNKIETIIDGNNDSFIDELADLLNNVDNNNKKNNFSQVEDLHYTEENEQVEDTKNKQTIENNVNAPQQEVYI
jgi:hypothetical protein